MVVANVVGAEVMVSCFLSLMVGVASVVSVASLEVVTEPDSTTDIQRRSLEALVEVAVVFELVVASELVVAVPYPTTDMQRRSLEALVEVVVAFELVVASELVVAVPYPTTDMQRRSLEALVEVVVAVVEVFVEEVVLSVVVVFLSSSDVAVFFFSGSPLGSSEPESEGVFGVEGGGLGPPGEGFPDGDQPPPRPQLWSDGQRRGTIQPPTLPPPEFVVPEPQISLNTQPHATVGFEPFEVVTEVAVKTTLLVCWPLVTLTV